MPKLKCNVNNCAYNYNQLCSRNAIDVEGPSARAKKETACLSYAPKSAATYSYEFADFDQTPKPETYVYCDAKKCVFEHDSRCQADKIEIKSDLQQDKKHNFEANKYHETFWSSSQTMCKTFEPIDENKSKEGE